MSAYISYEDNSRVIICADDNTGRRSRAAQINAVKRSWERVNKVQGKLTLRYKSYDEIHGFLSRSKFTYAINYKGK